MFSERLGSDQTQCLMQLWVIHKQVWVLAGSQRPALALSAITGSVENCLL